MSKQCNAMAAAGVYPGKSALPGAATMMKRSYTTFGHVNGMTAKCAWIVLAMLLVGAGTARADETAGDDEQDSAEVTIRLMDASEASLPDAVTAEIPIPASMPAEAAFGIETANDARERRETGLARAERARENAENMAEEARENRENRGRSDDARPDNVPERPDRPQSPGG